MSAWVQGRELERLAAAARIAPEQARRLLEALEAQGYVVCVRRELVAVAAAAEAALRHQAGITPASYDLRPVGECKGCGRDVRHVGRCCPDCSCHQLLDAARR